MDSPHLMLKITHGLSLNTHFVYECMTSDSYKDVYKGMKNYLAFYGNAFFFSNNDINN